MNRLAVAICLPLFVAGCANLKTGGTVDKVRAAFAYTCQAEPVAHGVFLTLGPGRVDPRIVDLEAKAHLAAASICASNPSDIPTALAALTKAFSEVWAAQAHATRVAQSEGVNVSAIAIVKTTP